ADHPAGIVPADDGLRNLRQRDPQTVVCRGAGSGDTGMLDRRDRTMNEGNGRASWLLNVLLAALVGLLAVHLFVAADPGALKVQGPDAPGNPLMPDQTFSGSLTNGTDTITQAVNGYGGIGVVVTGTWSGVIIVQVSCDNAVTFNHSTLWEFGGSSASPRGQGQTNIQSNGQYSVLGMSGVSHVRVSFCTYTSGTAQVTGRATQSGMSAELGCVVSQGSTNLTSVSPRILVTGGIDLSATAQYARYSSGFPAANDVGLFVAQRPYSFNNITTNT